ncbi:TonB-dependent receptor, partial [Lysobacter sp. 2RAB21]
MTLKTTKLRDAIVFALCVGATSLAGTGLASAQDAAAPAAPAAEDATTLDRIQVTGSRISIPGLTTNSPVMTVSQEEIARNQPVTAEDFLKIVPGAVPSIGPGTNNGANGGATIN